MPRIGLVLLMMVTLVPAAFAWDDYDDRWDDNDWDHHGRHDYDWNTQFRFGLLSAAEFGESPDGIRGAAESYGAAGEESRLGGLYWEVLIDKVGFGMRYLGRFDAVGYDSTDLRETDSWWIDWKGDLFISYHLFEQRSLLDPFVQYGIGSAGRSSLESDGHYEVDKAGDYRYVSYEERGDEARVTHLALYQYLAGGLAVNLSNLQLGARFGYNLVEQGLPGGTYPPDGSNRFEVSLFGGVALGGS